MWYIVPPANRETKLRRETRLKEHQDACERGMMEKLSVVEHAWEDHHPIHWETTVLDHGREQLNFNSTSILGVVYCQSCKARLAQRVCLYVNQSKNLFRTSPLTPGLPCVQLVMLVAWYARLFSGFTK